MKVKLWALCIVLACHFHAEGDFITGILIAFIAAWVHFSKEGKA